MYILLFHGREAHEASDTAKGIRAEVKSRYVLPQSLWAKDSMAYILSRAAHQRIRLGSRITNNNKEHYNESKGEYAYNRENRMIIFPKGKSVNFGAWFLMNMFNIFNRKIKDFRSEI